METMKLVSLSELAQLLSLNKSKLSYYASLKLIIPDNTIGRMMIFKKDETIELVKKIERLRKKGLSLEEIKIKL